MRAVAVDAPGVSWLAGAVVEVTCPTLVVVTEQPAFLRMVTERAGPRVATAATGSAAAMLAAYDRLGRELIGVVLDLELRSDDALALLEQLRARDPRLPAASVGSVQSEHALNRAAELNALPLPRRPTPRAFGAWLQGALAYASCGHATVSRMLAAMHAAFEWTPREFDVVLAAERGLSVDGAVTELDTTHDAVCKARERALHKAGMHAMNALTDHLYRAVIYGTPLRLSSAEQARRARERATKAVRRPRRVRTTKRSEE